jgi:cell division protein FtsI/penicillin-binding protein 2
MDPTTGRVLSIVNQNMAVRTPIKPCSTIKPFVALAALNEGLMSDSDTRTLRACNCEVDMDDALAYSNNEYFQQLGRQLGISKLCNYYREFGLGVRTGINLPGESAGFIPDGVPDKGLGRVASHGDGVGVTALQLASFISAIANGGSLYQPQVVSPGKRFTPILRRQLAIEPAHRRAILEGLADAVDHGTARRAQNPYEVVAGKTGSCIGEGSWVGLFASFSNIENPNLVVVVITLGSSSRGKYAADIAGDVYQTVSSRYGAGADRPRRVASSREAANHSVVANK